MLFARPAGAQPQLGLQEHSLSKGCRRVKEQSEMRLQMHACEQRKLHIRAFMPRTIFTDMHQLL